MQYFCTKKWTLPVAKTGVSFSMDGPNNTTNSLSHFRFHRQILPVQRARGFDHEILGRRELPTVSCLPASVIREQTARIQLFEFRGRIDK